MTTFKFRIYIIDAEIIESRNFEEELEKISRSPPYPKLTDQNHCSSVRSNEIRRFLSVSSGSFRFATDTRFSLLVMLNTKCSMRKSRNGIDEVAATGVAQLPVKHEAGSAHLDVLPVLDSVVTFRTVVQRTVSPIRTKLNTCHISSASSHTSVTSLKKQF